MKDLKTSQLLHFSGVLCYKQTKGTTVSTVLVACHSRYCYLRSATVPQLFRLGLIFSLVFSWLIGHSTKCRRSVIVQVLMQELLIQNTTFTIDTITAHAETKTYTCDLTTLLIGSKYSNQFSTGVK